jgi:hypothetical protein
MGQLRVAEIEVNAQVIWGTCCPASQTNSAGLGCNPSLWLMRLMKMPALAKAHEEKLPVLKESLTMAKTRTHNPPSHEAMVKGRQISYQISNSRGSGHSPPYKV